MEGAERRPVGGFLRFVVGGRDEGDGEGERGRERRESEAVRTDFRRNGSDFGGAAAGYGEGRR